jgi:hypothetical protein
MMGDLDTVADPKIALREAGRKKLEDFKNKRMINASNEKVYEALLTFASSISLSRPAR